MTEYFTLKSEKFSEGAWDWIYKSSQTLNKDSELLSIFHLLKKLPQLDLLLSRFYHRIMQTQYYSISTLFDIEPNAVLNYKISVSLNNALKLAEEYATKTIPSKKIHCRHLFVGIMKSNESEIFKFLPNKISADAICKMYLKHIVRCCSYDDITAWHNIILGSDFDNDLLSIYKINSVFLSYKSCDKSWVEKFSLDLLRNGIEVWFDEWEISPGDSIPSKIQKGLSKSNYLLFIMSKESVKESSHWVNAEWQSIFMEEKRDGVTRIIPIKIENVEAPILLRDKRFIDFSNDIFYKDNFDYLIKILAKSNKNATIDKFRYNDIEV